MIITPRRLPVMPRLLPIAAAVLAVGCGARTAHGPSGVPAGDAGGDTAINCGTFRSHRCGPGSYCWGENPSCDSVWQCRPDPPRDRCTAGIVGLYCGCDGVVTVSDGCPMRFHYSLTSQFRIHSGMDGQPCHPDRAPPYALTYRITGQGLAEVEGREVLGVFLLPGSGGPGPGSPGFHRLYRTTVTDGRFQWTIQPGGPLADAQGRAIHQNYGFEVVFDVDGDGGCTDGVDRAASGTAGPADLIALTIPIRIDRQYLRPPSETSVDTCQRIRSAAAVAPAP